MVFFKRISNSKYHCLQIMCRKGKMFKLMAEKLKNGNARFWDLKWASNCDGSDFLVSKILLRMITLWCYHIFVCLSIYLLICLFNYFFIHSSLLSISLGFYAKYAKMFFLVFSVFIRYNIFTTIETNMVNEATFRYFPSSGNVSDLVAYICR